MPYRNDEEAVEARRVELERELADVKERSNEFAYLSWKQKELESELAELKKRKASYTRTRLPMLAQAKIASPCNASWENMTGNDQVRFCGSCQKNVYDLSTMTSVEAEALLQEKEGDLCARFYRRADGTIMTSDCSVGVRNKRVRQVASAALFFGSAAMAFSAYEKSQVVKCPTGNAMGAVAFMPDENAPRVMGSVAPPNNATPPTEAPQKSQKTMGVMVAPHPQKPMGGLRAPTKGASTPDQDDSF